MKINIQILNFPCDLPNGKLQVAKHMLCVLTVFCFSSEVLYSAHRLNDIFHIIHKSFVLNISVCSNFFFIPAVTNIHFKSLHGIYSFCFHGNNETDPSDMKISIYSENCCLAGLSWIWILQLNIHEFYLYTYHVYCM